MTEDANSDTIPIPLKTWRAKRDISVSYFYTLKAMGLAPEVIFLAGKQYVFPKADREWAEKIQDPKGKAAQIAAEKAKMYHERAVHAVNSRKDRQ